MPVALPLEGSGHRVYLCAHAHRLLCSLNASTSPNMPDDNSYQEYLEYIRDHAIIVSDPGDEQEHIYNLL